MTGRDPGTLALAVERRLSAWDRESVGRRIWEHDPTVWAEPGTPEIANRLGWLHLPTTMADRVGEWESFAEGVDVADIVLCGMGGSSLAPEVFAGLLSADGAPRLTVADTTHPDVVAAITRRLDPGRTLFVVSSKSGGTLETLSLFRHFWAWRSAAGHDAGSAFVAITDPGSRLEDLAVEREFAMVFDAPPDVGGRFSALCDFGMLPAALVGVDVDDVLARARGMAAACGPSVPDLENPGLWLGAMLGEAALAGRDKATFVTPPELAGFGAWLEQLVAESTGKHGVGIVPVVDEPLGDPAAYADDRVFVAYHLEGSPPDPRLEPLEEAGHPVVRVPVDAVASLGAEMFRAELATAAAGAVLGINPFDQPDVEAAKVQARGLMEGSAPVPQPPPDLGAGTIDEVLGALRPGGYVSVQAYTADGPPDDLVATLRARTTAPVTIGIGPRFLHSSGQLHKGGGDGCVALQLVDEPHVDLPIPESDLTFGRVIAAQAAGDAAVLSDRGRTVVRATVPKKT